MPDNADTVVLFEELAVQDALPVLWRATAAPPDPQTLAGLCERNFQVLQALDALEDHALIDLADESSPLAAEFQRLDRKLTLLLELVAQLLTVNRPRPAPVPIRFNALGAEWRAGPAGPRLGSTGILEIFVHECVAQPLRFPGTITGIAPDGEVKVRFAELEDTVASLVGKIAFRRHRRQIAGRLNPQRNAP